MNLFTVVVLPPGSRKSAVFAALTNPLLEAEKELCERFKPQIVEAELARKVAARAAEKTATAAANADIAARDALLAEANAAAMHLESIIVPVRPQLVADDITPENAASLLAQQGGRLAVLSPEGGIFATLAGRYSGTPNLEVFLKGHAGDMLRVNRQTRDPEHIPHPALTLGLAVQPDVLTEIASMPGFRGKGLLARILFSLPTNTVGNRQIGTQPVPLAVNADYSTNLSAMVNVFAKYTEPQVLSLTEDANQAVLHIEQAVEPRLAQGGEWAHIVDWGSKYCGAVIRIAGLLHLAEHVHSGHIPPVTAETIQRANVLGEYFAAHALAAFDTMSTDPVIDDAREILNWITSKKINKFTKRELFSQTYRGRFRKATDLDPGLALLTNHGYIQPQPTTTRAGPGRRPSPIYTAHPELIA